MVRSIRRSILLVRKLAEPLPTPNPAPDCTTACATACIATRPIDQIIADLARNLKSGFIPTDRKFGLKRRTPASPLTMLQSNTLTRDD